jgi:Tfp pilus assembly protein PilF
MGKKVKRKPGRVAASPARKAARASGEGKVQQLLVAGLAHHQAGRWAEAERLYTSALELDPANADGLYLRGTVFSQTGRWDAAIQEIGAAVELDPHNPRAFNNLGTALKGQGHLDEAAAKYSDALRLKPDYPDALYNLGTVLTEQGHLDEAVARYSEALRLKPDYHQALNNLGTALRKQGKLDEAIVRYSEALRLMPDYPDALNNLGNALQEQDKLDEAIACYRAALDLRPDHPDTHLNLGVALKVSGSLDEAYHAFEVAVGLAPERGTCYRMLADTGRITPDSPYLRRMEELAANMAALPEADRMELHFALGAVYADCGQQERSFRHLLAGNRLKRGRIAYDEAGALALFERIRSVFTAELLAADPEDGSPSRLPVFVVGMPRSGTTLVEQILASHPQVFGAGELMDLPRLTGNLEPAAGLAAFPEAVAVLSRERLGSLGDAYLDGLRTRAPSVERIVDKLPDNFLRVGLIHMALPGARIVHVRRDPVDTCLSCFSKLFTDELPYTYDLAELGRFYRAYEGLMEHWRQVLPPGVMLEVRYEDVVADLEGQARRIIDHCGLPWDARCLAFHLNRRLVRTASSVQVRRPLYASSVGRWCVFADLARPLLDALRGESG